MAADVAHPLTEFGSGGRCRILEYTTIWNLPTTSWPLQVSSSEQFTAARCHGMQLGYCAVALTSLVILLHIYCSFSTGKVPSNWLNALVTPVHKVLYLHLFKPLTLPVQCRKKGSHRGKKPAVKHVSFWYLIIKPRLHDTTCCQTVLTTGCVVLTHSSGCQTRFASTDINAQQFLIRNY